MLGSLVFLILIRCRTVGCAWYWWDLRICAIKMIYNGNFNQREQKNGITQPQLHELDSPTMNVNLVFIRILRYI